MMKKFERLWSKVMSEADKQDKDDLLERAVELVNQTRKNASSAEGHLDNVVMPIRNHLFEARDRKGLLALARKLPDGSMARRYTVQLIYRLDDLEIDEIREFANQ